MPTKKEKPIIRHCQVTSKQSWNQWVLKSNYSLKLWHLSTCQRSFTITIDMMSKILTPNHFDDIGSCSMARNLEYLSGNCSLHTAADNRIFGYCGHGNVITNRKLCCYRFRTCSCPDNFAYCFKIEKFANVSTPYRYCHSTCQIFSTQYLSVHLTWIVPTATRSATRL